MNLYNLVINITMTSMVLTGAVAICAGCTWILVKSLELILRGCNIYSEFLQYIIDKNRNKNKVKKIQ